MKKVLFTATVDSHIKAFHLPYLKMFKDKGYEVHVATNGSDEIDYCDKKHIITFERNPFKLNNIKAIKKLRKIIETEEFDIIHTHTPMGSVVTRLAARKVRKKGTRVIYTAHGFHFFKGASIINWLVYFPVEYVMSYFTDDLITINTEDYERAKKKLKAKNTHYIPGVGVSKEKFDIKMSKKEISEYRKDLGLSDDDIVLIYVAEMNKNKNQKMVIEAMKLLIEKNKSYKLLLVGKDSYNGFHQKMVDDMNLNDCIKILGFRTDIPKLFKISNIAVSASQREGLPLNLIEANFSGLPIVCTDNRGHRDLREHSDNIRLVKLGDVDGMIVDILNIHIKNYRFMSIYEIEKISEKMSVIYSIN